MGAQVVRSIQAYPVYDLSYQANIDIVKAFLNQHDGLHMVGRGGTFRYNNADHSIEMGLLLGRRLLGEEIDYESVNTEQEYHEEIRSPAIARDHYHVEGEDEDEEVAAEAPSAPSARAS